MIRSLLGNRLRWLQRLIGLPALCLVLLIACKTSICGPVAVANDDLGPAAAALGINGRYRIGQWTAVDLDALFEIADVKPKRDDRITLETRDGDGGPILFEQAAAPESDAPESESSDATPGKFSGGFGEGLIIPGSASAPFTLRIDGEPVLKTRFAPEGNSNQTAGVVPAGMPWVMVFGDPLDLDTIGKNELLGRQASIAVSVIDRADVIPTTALTLGGVDLMLLTQSGVPVLQACSPQQRNALRDWLIGGGQCVVCIGPDGGEILAAADWLADLLPPSVVKARQTDLDPAGFESFTNSQSRLSTISGINLPKTVGRRGVGETLIAGRTSRRVAASLAARYAVGMGEVRIIAGDLEQEPFRKWPERLDLLRRIAGPVIEPVGDEAEASIRIGGYRDLSGQVRRKLDQFTLKRSFSFASIAVVIGGLFLFVAPLDYYLVTRRLRRPLLGWLTFSTVAVACSVALIAAARPVAINPQSASSGQSSSAATPLALARMNSMEFLDVDLATGLSRLHRWGFVYSHHAATVSLKSSPTPLLADWLTETDHFLLAPFGYPGRDLGGIQIETNAAPQTVSIRASQRGSRADAFESLIDQSPLLPRSSKSIAVSVQASCDSAVESLQMQAGTELLQGQLKNPFPADLLDGMLIYQNWVYFLPSRFPVGGIISNLDTLRQKNFRWQLSRQRALESSSEGESWNVIDVESTQRLAEMLMFHESAGGVRYTSLQHEILGDLDFSHLLNADRAFLVGRVAQPWTEITMNDQLLSGESLSMVRGVWPVRPAKSSLTGSTIIDD